jgi:4-amino-4-deoxy-L-arabinose transferase-like glycosyltransferase
MGKRLTRLKVSLQLDTQRTNARSKRLAAGYGIASVFAHYVGNWKAALVVALIVRMAAAVIWDVHFGGKFVFGDSDSYWHLARALARGEEYRYGNARIFRAPGYPAALAPLFWISSSDPPTLLARIEGALLGTVTVGLLYLWARRLFGESAGTLAAWLSAVYPGAVAASIFVLSEALFCPLMVGALACSTEAIRSRSWQRLFLWSALAGFLHGLAILTRPSWLLFPLFAGIVLLLLGGLNWRGAFSGFIVLVMSMVSLTPWWFRNWCLTGRWVPTTLQVGATLYDGLHPGATGASNFDHVARRMKEILEKGQFRGSGLVNPERSDSEENGASGDPRSKKEDKRSATREDGHGRPAKSQGGGKRCQLPDSVRRQIELEVYLDQELRREALQWVAAHPDEFFLLALRKFFRLWNIWPNEPAFRWWPMRIVVAAGFLPVIGLGLLRIIWLRNKGWEAVFLALPAIYFTGIHCILVSSLRYREPAVVVLIPAAAGAIALLAERFRYHRQEMNRMSP